MAEPLFHHVELQHPTLGDGISAVYENSGDKLRIQRTVVLFVVDQYF